MKGESADVVVVGGGPAGSTAAFQLARAGYDVLLVDKARHPRETVGESLLPSVWPYLDMLGVSDQIVSDGYVKKAGGVVCWDGQLTEISFRDFGYSRPGLHVERAPFDKLLLDAARGAGVRVCEGVRAERFVEPDAAGRAEVRLVDEDGAKFDLPCRLLIDASGQASFLARQRDGRRLDPDFRFVSLWGYFANSNYVSSGGVVRRREEMAAHPPMTFVSRLAEWGWSWHIPLRETTSVGLNIPVDLYRRDAARHASMRQYFLSACAETPHLGRLLCEAELVGGRVQTIRDYSYAADDLSGPGYFIVGDAAGFVDPIFSLGVVMALYSGHLAAWAADRSLRNPAAAAASAQLFAGQLKGRHALARAMALPSDKARASQEARRYFEFFSESEKELMWAAASMTTRSANMVRAAGGDKASALKRRELQSLAFP